MPDDRVKPALPHYRIAAAQAHSWSNLLLEDETGGCFLFAVSAGSVTPVDAAVAEGLLSSRAYRPWRGERGWHQLDDLPVLKIATPLSGPDFVPEAAEAAP